MAIKKDLSEKQFMWAVLGIVLIAAIIVYKQIFWYYPRSYKYERKLIHAIKDLQDKTDTLSTFRLDSIMDFKWDRVVYIGPYMDMPEETRRCGIDFSILRNTALSHSESFNGLLFIDVTNQAVKFLEFKGLIYGLESVNQRYPCGIKKDQAVFRLHLQKVDKEAFYRLQLVK